MKYLLLLLAFPIISASECGSKKDKTVPAEENVVKDETTAAKDSVPVCVRKIIDDTKGKLGGPVKIDEYLYKKHTVYLLTAPCCDQFNVLYDDSCKLLCAPSGGFTGKGDNKCKDFADSSKFVKEIWKLADK